MKEKLKEMKEEKIEIKSGLEIHQQLDTAKLFCRCPSLLKQDSPDVIIRRKIRAVAGESGEVDIAARHEQAKEKEFIYEGYSNSTCLVEFDEEPPLEINQEALRIALQVSLLLNAKPFPVIQVMRKTVVDGSNTSGFQRTLLLAKDGFVETEHGKVGIQSICLEEDAARIISKQDGQTTYRLDRLGIPLIEIATKPEIKSPEQAKEVALHIGEILRACKVKRGLGTIRQDVNLSVTINSKWGQRIEIKGVQEPELIKRTINTEIERQKKLIKENKSISEVRKANEDGSTEFLRPMPGEERMYPETDIPLVKISKEFITEINKSLPRLKHEIREDLKEKGLEKEMIQILLEENKLEEYKQLISAYSNPNLIVKMLILWQKEIASREKISETKIAQKLSLDVLETILLKLMEKVIKESEVKEIMIDIVKGKTVEEAIKKEKISEENVEKEIQQILKEKPGLSINAYMGLVMGKFKGKVSAQQAAEILKKYVK